MPANPDERAEVIVRLPDIDMKLLIAAGLMIALVRIQLLRRKRPPATRSELRAAFRREGTLHDGMRYTHYCAQCRPVRQHGRYDLYICSQEPVPIAVARYGNKPREHLSSPELVLPDEGLQISISRT